MVFGIRNTPKFVLLQFLFFMSKTDSGGFCDPKHTQIGSALMPHAQIRYAPIPVLYEQNGFDDFWDPKHIQIRSAPIPPLRTKQIRGFWDPKHTQICSAPIPPFTSKTDSGCF
jgi:hypothetical protein